METIRRTKIVDLLKCRDFGTMVNVKGWVRTRRGSKQVNFIALNDGSTINNVQVVVDLANFDEELLKQITTGACISVNGELVESVGSGQAAEIQAREIEVLGTCDNTYPLQKKGHSMEFCVKLLICVHVLILLELCSVFVIIWRLPSTSSSMTEDSSIFILRLSRLPTAKAQARCSR